MRSTKNIIFIGLGVLILLAQIIYVFTIRKTVIADILDLQSQSAVEYAQLAIQEKNLRQLPSLKTQLEQMNAQRAAAKNKIPTTLSAAQELIELSRLMISNQALDLQIEKLEEAVTETELGIFVEKKYRITYTSTYGETKAMVQNLNNSYQLLNISSFTIDNSPQQDQENRELLMRYGEHMQQVVSSTIEFSMFMLNGGVVQDEIYTTTFTGLQNSENTFLNTDNTGEEVTIESRDEEPGEESSQPSTTQQQTTSLFKLDLWDVLASGDNYSFVGPGEADTVYTGLKSSKNTYITLNIREDGYNVVIEDEQGNIKQNGALVPIDKPTLSIDSDIVKIQETMPEIHIYIKNYTEDMMDVTLKGSLLETIHIYNEFEEEVRPGQTKGKVKIT
jgi:hypothetical protein